MQPLRKSITGNCQVASTYCSISFSFAILESNYSDLAVDEQCHFLHHLTHITGLIADFKMS